MKGPIKQSAKFNALWSNGNIASQHIRLNASHIAGYVSTS